MERILIADFGSQYTQLIARKIRELNVYCEIYPYYDLPQPDDTCKGLILSGSPASVHDPNSPRLNLQPWLNRLPVLGICYGAQLIADTLGGTVEKATAREYGRSYLNILNEHEVLFKEVHQNSQVWMSHADTITRLPEGFSVIARTNDAGIAAYRSDNGRWLQPVYCLQFHPEVVHSVYGQQILRNFCYEVCRCRGEWVAASVVATVIAQLRETIGRDHVLLALSGGVDSTVAAALLHQAIGDRLHCFFVDNGLLRKGEFEQVMQAYRSMKLNVRSIDARQRFLDALKGITDPEQKRKIIGELFVRIFEEQAASLAQVQWLAQGTIYPDVIESRPVHGPSATIKSHHNVGGLPKTMQLKVVEPLRMFFKDEVRRIGKELGIPTEILERHPFPGPGLAIRIVGEVTAEKVRLVQEADALFIDVLKQSGFYNRVWQAGAILLDTRSVGVMGDERTYEYVVALRAVESTDGMTADWSRLPHELLAKVANDIINNVKGINRVVYDISSKPPATIEWE
ncbi:MAG: glutamine-hydrolyzing GMP synthase [Chitinophagales bacterium]|nr:glutamine-hydrolyzing GMP synthase [Chitinophagales bacterium]MDW8428208.1 glutamine-hydrolyzing GMP synthase [Chitinophagales bacterium]